MRSTSTKQTRAARLAQAIVRDREARFERTEPAPAPTCMMCGRGYAARGSRFCSERCREAFDTGAPAYAPAAVDRYYTLPRSGTGFRIVCASCKQPFTSYGLRCCGVNCERALCKREERDRELADDPFRSPRPPCQCCGLPIPRWRNGRQVPTTARFCSDRCRKRHHQKRIPLASRILRRQTANKCPQNRPPSVGDVAAVVLARTTEASL
jgi:hypothetical protein